MDSATRPSIRRGPAGVPPPTKPPTCSMTISPMPALSAAWAPGATISQADSSPSVINSLRDRGIAFIHALRDGARLVSELVHSHVRAWAEARESLVPDLAGLFPAMPADRLRRLAEGQIGRPAGIMRIHIADARVVVIRL